MYLGYWHMRENTLLLHMRFALPNSTTKNAWLLPRLRTTAYLHRKNWLDGSNFYAKFTEFLARAGLQPREQTLKALLPAVGGEQTGSELMARTAFQ